MLAILHESTVCIEKHKQQLALNKNIAHSNINNKKNQKQIKINDSKTAGENMN